MNTVCFVGVFQFLGTYISTRNPWAIGIFINGVIYHVGCKWWRWPDILFNFVVSLYTVWIHWNFFTTMCLLYGTTIYILNTHDIVHVMGVQYLGNISLLQGGNPDWIPSCILLGIITATIINGTSRLANGGTVQERTPKARLTQPSTEGEGPTRRWGGCQDHNRVEDCSDLGTGCAQAS